MGTAATPRLEIQPSFEFAVFQKDADQSSKLSCVVWGGVELVLELNKSASILELSIAKQRRNQGSEE